MTPDSELALPPEPDPRAPHSAWLEYAIDRGMPRAEALLRTRDQIRAALAPAGPPIGGAPDLERHEQDAEVLAARNAGRP